MAQSELMRQYIDLLSEKASVPAYDKEQYIGWAKKYAEQFNVPLPMVLHAMFKETGWLGDPERMRTATSPTGARGIMQIQPQYAEKGAYKIKVSDLTDPEKNIEAGVRGLAYFLQKTGDPQKALAAYNAGEGGAARYIKSGDIKHLPRETRRYVQGYKNDIEHQLEKFFPKNKDKVSQIATNILATAVGAGDAQAADNTPNSRSIQASASNDTKKDTAKDGKGGPQVAVDRNPASNVRQPSASELNKIDKNLKTQPDPVAELEKVIQQMKEKGQKTADLEKKLVQLKKDYERDKAKLGSLPNDDPNSTYVNLGPLRLKVDRRDSTPWKFPSIQSNLASTDYQSQGDDKPAPKTTTTRRTPVPNAVPAVDDFGRVIEPATVPKEKSKTVARAEPQVSNTRTQPTARELDAVRSIIGTKGPLIDPFTGQPTTEKALRAKIEKMQQDAREAEQARAKFAAIDPRRVDQQKDQKSDAGTGLNGTDKGKTSRQAQPSDSEPKSVTPKALAQKTSNKKQSKNDSDKKQSVDTSIGAERKQVNIGGYPVTIGSQADLDRLQRALDAEHLRQMAGDDLEKLQQQPEPKAEPKDRFHGQADTDRDTGQDNLGTQVPGLDIEDLPDMDKEDELERLIKSLQDREISEHTRLRLLSDIIKLNEAETSQVSAPTAEPATRRVVVNPDGTTTSGFKPTPRDPNEPLDPKIQARMQRRSDAEAAERSWLDQRPAGFGWGGKLPANLNPNDVRRIQAGEHPDQVILGRSSKGSFGTDPSKYRDMAQQWLDWHSTAPPKYDPLADQED